MQITPQTRIGWIGTGVMGAAMCGHVTNAGYRVTVYNRTRAKAQSLIDRGATWADTPRAVAQASDVVFTMVGFPADVREVYLGSNGILAGIQDQGNLLPSPSILVDMTTSPPSLSREIAEAAAAKGVAALDAPVTGGDVGAKNATLSIMVGGDEAALNAIRPLLETMGKNIVYHGGPGAGQNSKMCNQIVIAGTMVGVCEALVYGKRAGLDLEKVLASISGGAAGCWSLTNYWPRVLKGNFDPGFFVEHFVKDMGIALEEAKRMNLALPGLALVHELYTAAQAQGYGRLGTHSLVLTLEQMSTKLDREEN